MGTTNFNHITANPVAYLSNVLLGTAVRGLQKLASDFQVAVDDQCLIRAICVDSHAAHVVDGFRVGATLESVLHIALKLARVGCLEGDRD